MNALDELEEIKELVNNDKHFKYKNIVNFNCESIEKFLKALEIIKEKDVNIGLVKVLGSVEQYNQTYVYDNMLNVKWCLTEEEFNLLKESVRECQK